MEDADIQSNEVVKPDPLTKNELEFCSYVEQIYRLHHVLPTFEQCSDAVGISRVEYERLWNNQKVARYLSGIGLDVERIRSATNVLTPIQLLTINTMLDYNDKRPDARKLKELNVSTKQWQAWRSDPAFADYIKARVENIVGGDTDEIDRALFDRARAGDISAIKYINEYTGRYRPQTEAGFDPRLFLIKIQEIILRYVQDRDTLQLIAKDLEQLAVESGSAHTTTVITQQPAAIPVGAHNSQRLLP
jgi:hypothetical protein